MNLNDMYARIGDYVRSHEYETYGQIAASLGLSRSQVSRIARRVGIRRGPGNRAAALEAAVAVIDAASQKRESELTEQTVPSADQAVPAAPDPAPADVLELQ
jgi:hypothetical protein